MNNVAAIAAYLNSNLNTPLNELIGQIPRGPIISKTPPENTSHLWIDTSTDDGVLKFYNDSTGIWEVLNISSGIELDSDIEE